MTILDDILNSAASSPGAVSVTIFKNTQGRVTGITDVKLFKTIFKHSLLNVVNLNIVA